MPQLDISTYTSQLFWLCVTFFTMLFIMSVFITPKIADILKRRQSTIDDMISEADEKNQKALKMLEQYHQSLAEATSKANRELETTQKEMNEMIAKKQAELNSQLNKKVKESEAKINSSREDALSKIENMSDSLANDILEKVGLDLKIKG